MKRSRSVLALGLTVVMMFQLTACKKVVEYDEESLITVLEDELGMDEDEIYTAENDSSQNGYPDADLVTARYGDARINAVFVEDADEAEDLFAEYYDEFIESFDAGDSFEGNYIFKSSDGSGYIVVNGSDIGTNVFGGRFSSGDVYIGLYYSGPMIIFVTPENMDSDLDDVGAVIEALGYPNV